MYPNKQIANAASREFGNNIWYMSDVLVGCSFVDDEAIAEEKKWWLRSLNMKIDLRIHWNVFHKSSIQHQMSYMTISRSQPWIYSKFLICIIKNLSARPDGMNKQWDMPEESGCCAVSDSGYLSSRTRRCSASDLTAFHLLLASQQFESFCLW